ncbi:hypothetical protein GDO78_016993 [Eleutherodactylus coqui]|uniref:Uncharacterized protein n=1 Tax=Eleutherodactylus coqui TaxID=57060 RepID=A0A8J6EKP2_ELECQ|nr:hypothetical protein GDO78_016993 [Eleutherodactylus coqui]
MNDPSNRCLRGEGSLMVGSDGTIIVWSEHGITEGRPRIIRVWLSFWNRCWLGHFLFGFNGVRLLFYVANVGDSAGLNGLYKCEPEPCSSCSVWKEGYKPLSHRR